MSADELFDDDNWDYDAESEPSRKKKSSNKVVKETQDDFDDDWDDGYSQSSGHGKKRNRLRDIEDRLERKRLRRESSWDYDDLLN